MIWESCYWKEPLLASSKEVLGIGQTENPSDDELGKLEYLVMTGFYSIRKLLEAETKLSSSTRDGTFTTIRYPIKRVRKNLEISRIEFLKGRLTFFTTWSVK